ncbi:MAG: aminomethyl-transferring glycine dehydrogenase [Actinobacteria bacterium]|uniref:glycine dehydrogenase (aminomethyl-transferring) n=1 Tax=freshwater metagenome TaxID=449393 RepID=A0A6J6CZD0_9ZZZZ|nr:aminomethyl-transferring glycine dehydrogenase [Actinomycetota bacterium]
MNTSLHSLTTPGFSPDHFAYRHLGLTDADRRHMLDAIGAQSLEELLEQTIPQSIRLTEALSVPTAIAEHDVLALLKQKFSSDVQRTSLIGQGYYNTITPPVLRRNMIENPAWYTAYTPYQPEISQGRLEALLNFQTMISELVALPLANASLLDEATAVAEAVTMAHRTSKGTSDTVLVDRNIHPQTMSVLTTRLEPIGLTIEQADIAQMQPADHFAVVVSWPGSNGELADIDTVTRVVNTAHEHKALAIAVCDLLACTIIVPPGELNFDIAVGSSQRFGVPMGFGGPHAAFMATRLEYARSLPGRLVGVSTDTEGRPALRLTLQTREQHIRREKATSNICTAQVLLANLAGMYGVWHGPDGLSAIAHRVHALTVATAEALHSAGHELLHKTFFDTVAVKVEDASAMSQHLRAHGFNVRVLDDTSISFSFDETTTLEKAQEFAALWDADLAITMVTPSSRARLGAHGRSSSFMEQSVFHRYRSEHEMLRYLRSLADKDLALDRTMIPLGSCTMKLNSTTEMEPVTWPEFSGLHPFVPEDESVGIRSVITELEGMLVAITGYDAISLQPNAGSQGEFAGLLAIRAYHHSRGDTQRTICLIPSSAHGTNAASAVMAGMDVVVVNCDAQGNIDVEDLRAKAQQSGERLAATMITYPSTHGVFEEAIGQICAIIHDNGGQVYVDGANMNALVGTAQPGRFGADVSHLNLHKTFCIPHGGGGPGVGPVVARAHLAPFLPGDPRDTDSQQPAISAAPFGSASILAIPWVYIMMMGPQGLLQATADAILSANYIATRIHNSFPILYRGNHERVAHECILDVGTVLTNTGLTIDDVAKRLMDYGFHAPTMSFPVANTLMVEPTESESLAELDRFCDSMISIRHEIDSMIATGTAAEDSVLRHSPHTIEDIAQDWNRAYTRQEALFPLPWLRQRHYHPPVSRIDAAFGDRNIVCTCAPIEAYSRTLETDTVSV